MSKLNTKHVSDLGMIGSTQRSVVRLAKECEREETKCL